MASPNARLRKQLSAPGLLATVRQCFEQIPDHRQRRGQIRLSDALMSGLAVFSLKYPSLLKFDQAYGDEATLRQLLDPTQYLGLAAQFVARVLDPPATI